MKEPLWTQPRPDAHAIDRLWQSKVFTPFDFGDPDLDELLAALRKVYTHGGAEFEMFRFSDHPVIQWFISRNRPNEMGFFDHFLGSEVLRACLPELEIPPVVGPVSWEVSNPYVLAGEIASGMMSGGAYGNFPGSGRDAKTLAERACHALYGDRFEDILIARTSQPWAGWFSAIGWDATWVGVDKIDRRIWLLCITDTD